VDIGKLFAFLCGLCDLLFPLADIDGNGHHPVKPVPLPDERDADRSIEPT
jgi:hypothetical protein